MRLVMQIAVAAVCAAVLGGCNGDVGEPPWTFRTGPDAGTFGDTPAGGDRDVRTDETGTSSGATAIDLSAGWRHTCAVLQGGEVRCWGDGSLGALGDGSRTERSTPVEVEGISSATEISTGQGHSCAVLDGGGIRCWGDGRLGQLGNGDKGGSYKSTTPVEVRGISTAVDVVAGARHNCALLEGGRVRCWGEGSDGQLGDGNEAQPYRSATPVEVEGLRSATDVAAGSAFSCAALEGGGVRCWGSNEGSQLGEPARVNPSSAVPVEIEEISSASEITAGRYQGCAFVQSAGIRCWGLVQYTESENRPSLTVTPVEVQGIGDTVAVSAGSEHTCAVLESGEVRCWGRGGWGQLGDGEPDNPGKGQYWNTIPTAVEGIGSAGKVASGTSHTCALLESGGVRCWGRGEFGQLGNGTSRSGYASNTPVQVDFE